MDRHRRRWRSNAFGPDQPRIVDPPDGRLVGKLNHSTSDSSLGNFYEGGSFPHHYGRQRLPPCHA